MSLGTELNSACMLAFRALCMRVRVYNYHAHIDVFRMRVDIYIYILPFILRSWRKQRYKFEPRSQLLLYVGPLIFVCILYVCVCIYCHHKRTDVFRMRKRTLIYICLLPLRS